MSTPSEKCFNQNIPPGDRHGSSERPPRGERENDRENQAKKSVMDALQTEGLIFLAENAGFQVDYKYSSKKLEGYGYRKKITSVSCRDTLLISRDAILKELRDIRQKEQRFFIDCIRWLVSENVKLPEVLKGKEYLFAFKKSFHSGRNKAFVDEVNNAIRNEKSMPNSLYLNKNIEEFFQVICNEIDFVFTFKVLFKNDEEINGRLNLMAKTRMDNFLIELLRMNGRIVNVKKVRKGCRDNAFYKNSITNIKNANGVEVFNSNRNKVCLIAQRQKEEEVIILSSVP